MLAVMYIMSVNHSLEVFALMQRPPLDALMNNYIVKDEIKYAVAKNANRN